MLKKMVGNLLGGTGPGTKSAAAEGKIAAQGSDKWEIGFVEAKIHGASYFVPKFALDRPAAQAVLKGKFYEPKTHALIEHLFRAEKGEIVHAGTFFGDMLPSFAASAQGSKLYCFEPVLENYVLARLTVKANDLSNVILFNAALSDGTDNLRILTHNDDGAHRGGTARLANKGEIVPSIAIDQFDFENLICIQLDVEGHQLSAVGGAIQSIEKHQPIVLVEDPPKKCGQFMTDLGYTIRGEIPGLTVWASPQREKLLDGFAL